MNRKILEKSYQIPLNQKHIMYISGIIAFNVNNNITTTKKCEFNSIIKKKTVIALTCL